jgi:hypothetical protein
MSKLIGLVSAAFAVLAFLAVAFVFYGAATSAGMAVLAFQLWAVIAGFAAIALGVISRLLANRGPDGRGLAHFGFGLGAGSLLALAIGVFFLG